MGVLVDGCGASQRDLKRLEKWAKRSLVKFSKGNYKALGMNNARYLHRPGADQLENSFAGKVLGSWCV